MREAAVGLSVSVGSLAYLLTEDPEGAPGLREELARINEPLEANGLPPHVEPEQLPELIDRSGLHGMPYSWLRRGSAVFTPIRPIRPISSVTTSRSLST